MGNDLSFYKELLELEKQRLIDLLKFSKGVEHSATMDARNKIKRFENKIKENELK